MNSLTPDQLRVRDQVNDKKQRELQIFDTVYGDFTVAKVLHSERPDFLVRLFDTSPCFGVEVTEFYESDTSARLERIPNYCLDLLDGKEFKHRDDRVKLNVGRVDIVRENNSVHAKDVPAIIQPVPSINECSMHVAERIRTKTESMRNYPSELSHANLIIRDNTSLLRVAKVRDFYGIYFLPELISALSVTSFREVFLIAEIEERQVYARLKMLHLLAAAFLFNHAIVNLFSAEVHAPDVDIGELFASYFASTVEEPVLVHSDAAGTEVIFGDAGVIATQTGELTVRIHRDHPIYPDARPACLQWRTILGSGFHDTMNEYCKSHRFSTAALFPVKTS